MEHFEPIRHPYEDWDEKDVDHKMLDEKLAELGDNFLDPRNPDYRQIAINRDYRYQWGDYTAKRSEKQSADEFSSHLNHFDLNLYSILESGFKMADLANRECIDSLASTTRWNLTKLYDSKNLRFPGRIAHCLATADCAFLEEDRLPSKGIYVDGKWAYDLNVPLILDSTDFVSHRSEFGFFFALKLSQVPAIELDDFLGYQLETTFGGTRQEFARFLRQLVITYGSAAEFALISEETKGLIADWPVIQNLPINPPGKASIAASEIATVDNQKCIKEKLRAYFSEEDFKILEEILAGNPGDAKPVFIGDGSILITFFRDCLECKLIAFKSKEELRRWIVNSFKVDNGRDGIKDFSESNVRDYLTKNDRNPRDRIKI